MLIFHTILCPDRRGMDTQEKTAGQPVEKRYTLSIGRINGPEKEKGYTGYTFTPPGYTLTSTPNLLKSFEKREGRLRSYTCYTFCII